MLSVADIVDQLGGPTKFGEICGFTVNQASRGSDIRRRGSIPVDYWPKIVEIAFERGLQITYETLVQAHTMAPVEVAEVSPSP